MNFLIAVIIGAVVGAIVGYVLRERNARALVFGPVAGVVGGLIASALAAAFGTGGYGIWEALLQIVLAGLAAAGAVLFVPAGAGKASGTPSTTE